MNNDISLKQKLYKIALGSYVWFVRSLKFAFLLIDSETVKFGHVTLFWNGTALDILIYSWRNVWKYQVIVGLP